MNYCENLPYYCDPYHFGEVRGFSALSSSTNKPECSKREETTDANTRRDDYKPIKEED